MATFSRWSLVAAAFGLLGLASSVGLAQPGGPRWGQGWRGMNFPGANLFLLADENVQKDLDLSESQIEELTKLQEEIRTSMMNLFQGMERPQGGDMRQFFEDMQQKAEAAMKDFEAELEEILLPHQMKRLKQIAVQSRSRGRGIGGSILSEEMREELKITREQEDKLRRTAEELEKDLQEKINKLRRDAMNKLLEQLTAEQREKYRELVGDPIEFGNPFQNMMRGWGGNQGRRGGGGRSDF